MVLLLNRFLKASNFLNRLIIDNLNEIGVCASRRKDKTSPTNDKEKTQLRALLGELAPYLAAEVNLLLTEVTRSTVDTIIKANILLSQAKARKDHITKIHSFREEDGFGGVGMTIKAWHSQKIDRTCWSPGAAEAQAAAITEEVAGNLRKI